MLAGATALQRPADGEECLSSLGHLGVSGGEAVTFRHACNSWFMAHSVGTDLPTPRQIWLQLLHALCVIDTWAWAIVKPYEVERSPAFVMNAVRVPNCDIQGRPRTSEYIALNALKYTRHAHLQPVSTAP